MVLGAITTLTGMRYTVVFEGVNGKDAKNRTGLVHTIPEGSHSLRIAAVSCDRPERLRPGETNMWEVLAKQITNDEGEASVYLPC